MDEMTELERANKTCDAIYWGLEAVDYCGVKPADKMEMRKSLRFWRARVVELEAAEQQAQASDEPKHDLVLDRLAALERHFRSHTHDVPAVTGTTVTRGPTMHA